MPDDSYLVINNGTLTLKKRHSQKTAVSKAIDRAIRDLTPPINIIDLLVETTRWVKIDRRFGPLSGNQRKIQDYNKRLVATLFCYGCNLGPTQTARSIREISRQQVSYLNINHSRDKNIQKATSDVINSYNHYDLPKLWGTGDTASVDGTRFDMNDSDIQPDTIHGNTHAQSIVVFGLAHLMGIKLMPRIRDINSLNFLNRMVESTFNTSSHCSQNPSITH